ncbi:MAG: 50S ribosomal protein L6 [bacterium]|nr:50S ribosomal protein L6 [bacterium]
MSRIGKKPILIPESVDVKIEDGKVVVNGPKGELSVDVRPEVKVELKEDKIFVSTGKEQKNLWGLTRALIFNMVKGVTEGFEKKLELRGIGLKAELSGEELVLHVGFSHSIKLRVPKDIKVTIEKNIINISGANKGLVGQFAANIRGKKEPEPYKGKGIRYLGEYVPKKEGKKAATTSG